MCGFSGFRKISPDQSFDYINYLRRSSQALIQRGPDGDGIWINELGDIGFAHRRLAIIDTFERSNQPLKDSSNSNVIVFNGEIYNFKELREILISRGESFSTFSDTEVVLKMYKHFGTKFVKQLRGMYSFAIWDDSNRKLILGRDPFGIKPLYYFNNGQSFLFSSQVKSLVSGLEKKPDIENAGLVGFYLWGHIPEPFTLYKNLFSVPPGCCLSIDQDGNQKVEKINTINSLYEETQYRLEETSKEQSLVDAMSDSIRYHLVSDVPIGVFMSAGLDSTIIAYLVNKIVKSHDINSSKIQDIHYLTLGFNEYKNTPEDEIVLAERFAKDLSLNHHKKIISYNNFLDHMPMIIQTMDQPSIDGINTYFISWLAAELNLKVVLSGLGGDELFWGYKHFQSLKTYNAFVRNNPISKFFNPNFLPRFIKSRFPKEISLLGISSFSELYFLRRCLHMPWELEKFLSPEVVKDGLSKLSVHDGIDSTNPTTGNIMIDTSCLEVSWYMKNQLLRDSDWASMAHSVELRVPFVDYDFTRYILSRQKNGETINKQFLRSSFANVLPDYLINKPKTGFSTPINQWIGNKISNQNQFITKHPSKNWSYELIKSFL